MARLSCLGLVLLMTVSTAACGAGSSRTLGGPANTDSNDAPIADSDGGTDGSRSGTLDESDPPTAGETSPGPAEVPPEGQSGPKAGRYVYLVDGVERPTEIRRLDPSTVRIPGPGSSYVIERWQADAGYETEVSPGRGERCEWSPPLKRLPIPAAVGASWTVNSSCAHQEFRGEYEIVALSTFQVEGQHLETVKISFKETRTLTYDEPPGISTSTVSGAQTRTRFETEGESEYSPEMAIQVRVVATTRSTGYGGGQSGSESRLIDLP